MRQSIILIRFANSSNFMENTVSCLHVHFTIFFKTSNLQNVTEPLILKKLFLYYTSIARPQWSHMTFRT